MKNAIALCMLVLLAPVAAHAADVTLSVATPDGARTAYLHAPATLQSGMRYPLVLGFHGGGGTAEGYIADSQIFAKGERAGFIVVCPEGTSIGPLGQHRVWNSGPEYVQASHGADDVAFVKALIAQVEAKYAIDPGRIYATGFSNGGQMSYRLALALSDEIAAIAPMSGGILAAAGERPSSPVPVLHFQGTDDGFYPLAGGLGAHSIGHTLHAPIPEVIAQWVGFDGAAPAPRIVEHEGWREERHEGSSSVVLVLVNGMGHQIAGGEDDHLPDQTLKAAPDAIAMALAFFAESPRR